MGRMHFEGLGGGAQACTRVRYPEEERPGEGAETDTRGRVRYPEEERPQITLRHFRLLG